MTTTPERLRDLHRRAQSGQVTDFTLLLDAADEIERLQRRAEEADRFCRDNMPELYKNA